MYSDVFVWTGRANQKRRNAKSLYERRRERKMAEAGRRSRSHRLSDTIAGHAKERVHGRKQASQWERVKCERRFTRLPDIPASECSL